MKHFLLSVFVLAGCSAETSSVDPRKRLIASWWSDYLGPELTALKTETGLYRDSVATYCETGTQLDDARKAWGRAHRHVKRQQFFRFGPYVEFPERFVAKIDAWPADPDAIDTRLEDASIAFDQNYFDAAVSTIRGFPPSSYVLFSDDIDARDCVFLVGNADDLVIQTEALFVSWDPNQGGFYREFETMPPAESAAELVNRLWHQTENVSKNNIFEPMGLKGDGTPQPDQLEARFSDRTVDVMLDTMAAVTVLYLGNDEVIGVSSFVQNDELDAEIRDTLQDVNSRLSAIDISMTEAIVSRREALQSLIDALSTLQTLLEVDLLAELGFSRSFNDQDGD